jgi:hypothetical protein
LGHQSIRVGSESERRAPQVKGVAFRSTLTGLQRLRGEGVTRSVAEALSGSLGESVRFGGLAASAWYPLSSYRELLATIRRVTRTGPELLRALGRESSYDDFRGVYRIIAFVLSPERLIQQAPRAWSLYFDAGSLDIVEARDGMASARLTGCFGFDRNVWERAMGGCQGLLEVCGAKNVRLRVASGGGDGDDQLELEARWTR